MTVNTGRKIAAEVAEQIAARFPKVHVDISVQTSKGAPVLVDFIPPSKSSIRVWLAVFFDGSYKLDAGSSLEIEEGEPTYGVEAQIAKIVETIEEFGEGGLAEVRTHWFLGPLSPTVLGVLGIDQDVDESLAGRCAAVHRFWEGWL